MLWRRFQGGFFEGSCCGFRRRGSKKDSLKGFLEFRLQRTFHSNSDADDQHRFSSAQLGSRWERTTQGAGKGGVKYIEKVLSHLSIAERECPGRSSKHGHDMYIDINTAWWRNWSHRRKNQEERQTRKPLSMFKAHFQVPHFAQVKASLLPACFQVLQ